MSSDYTKATTSRASSVPRDELYLDHPPRGITMERTGDGTTVIRTRTHSPGAFPFIFFTLFWNGMTALFVAVAIDMTAEKLGMDARIFSEGVNHNFGWPLWLFWLFLTPFIAFGIYAFCSTVFSFLGRCEIRIGADEASVFTGIGPLGRTRRFSPQSVKFAGMKKTSESRDGDPVRSLLIEMKNGRQIIIPDLIKTRETWLAFALKKILARKK